MTKPLPSLTSDAAAARFVDSADLTQFDLSAMQPHSFEFAPKSRQINMRMPEPLLDAVKARAAERGMSYQRFIRQALEEALRRGSAS
jgi:predicted DNA binding CopG/RHH family protein